LEVNLPFGSFRSATFFHWKIIIKAAFGSICEKALVMPSVLPIWYFPEDDVYFFTKILHRLGLADLTSCFSIRNQIIIHIYVGSISLPS
jgi:hypothetical protein